MKELKMKKATKDEMKKEAIKRMKMLKIDKNIIKAFSKDSTITMNVREAHSFRCGRDSTNIKNVYKYY